jgi:hypothetical protein
LEAIMIAASTSAPPTVAVTWYSSLLMGWSDAIVGGAAALVGAGIGAYASYRATKATLNSDEVLQRNQLVADNLLSREEREHEQRRQAYAPMMAYLLWSLKVNQARAEVAKRRSDAVGKARGTNQDGGVTSAAAAVAATAMRDAYKDAGPTRWEQETIDSGPTAQDRFKTEGLAHAFASKDVLQGFVKVVDSTKTIDMATVRLDEILRDFPSPLVTQYSDEDFDAGKVDIGDGADAAKRLINASADMFKASMELLRAMTEYSGLVEHVYETMQSELDQYRPPTRS